jgi:hypothetical protein
VWDKRARVGVDKKTREVEEESVQKGRDRERADE